MAMKEPSTPSNGGALLKFLPSISTVPSQRSGSSSRTEWTIVTMVNACHQRALAPGVTQKIAGNHHKQMLRRVGAATHRVAPCTHHWGTRAPSNHLG